MDKLKQDRILRGTAVNDQFRVVAVDATTTVQSARDLHNLSPINTILMGRLISASAMMIQDMKVLNSSISLSLQCDGDVKGALVICEHGGRIRGYVKEPSLFFDNPEENMNLGYHVGKGTIRIIKDFGNNKTSTGTCEIKTGEIAEDLAHYYNQSEQIPSAVSLGVLFDKDARIRSAGGFIIQQLPFADQLAAEQIINNISLTPNITDLMDMGYTIEQILDKFILKGLEWKILESQKLEYKCTCNKERFSRALVSLGVEELKTMEDGIDTACAYCNHVYHFSSEEINELISNV